MALNCTRHPKALLPIKTLNTKKECFIKVTTAFFEFIETEKFFNKNPKRITIEDVEVGVDYVIIKTQTRGFGDTI